MRTYCITKKNVTDSDICGDGVTKGGNIHYRMLRIYEYIEKMGHHDNKLYYFVQNERTFWLFEEKDFNRLFGKIEL